MVNCEQIREYMSAMLDDEASAQEREAVFTHIETCDECRKFFEIITEINDNMTAEADLPEGFAQQVMDAVRGQVKKKKYPHLMRYLATAACVVIVGAVALGTIRGRLGMKSADSTAAVVDMNMAPQYMMTSDTAAAAETPAEAPEYDYKAEAADNTSEAYEEESAPEAEETPAPPETERADDKLYDVSESEQNAGFAEGALAEVPPEYEGYTLAFIDGEIPEIIKDKAYSEYNGRRIYELTAEQYETLCEMYKVEIRPGTNDGKYAAVIK